VAGAQGRSLYCCGKEPGWLPAPGGSVWVSLDETRPVCPIGELGAGSCRPLSPRRRLRGGPSAAAPASPVSACPARTRAGVSALNCVTQQQKQSTYLLEGCPLCSLHASAASMGTHLHDF
jgi:hypothetical protein